MTSRVSSSLHADLSVDGIPPSGLTGIRSLYLFLILSASNFLLSRKVQESPFAVYRCGDRDDDRSAFNAEINEGVRKSRQTRQSKESKFTTIPRVHTVDRKSASYSNGRKERVCFQALVLTERMLVLEL